MEVLEMEEAKKGDSHMTSAAAFVEGGIQESCEDACSICLEEFCESDPSTATSCRHEFHLQCILEWCQRSSQCPMCMRPISLKDPTSQELFEAVERERKLRATPSRNTTIFRHPTLGDFELQHLPIGATDADLEERIIQHLAAAAAMGRTRHFGRRDGQRTRSSSHSRPHFLVFSNHPNGQASAHVPSSFTQDGEENGATAATLASPTPPLTYDVNHRPLEFSSVLTDQNVLTSGSPAMPRDRQGISFNNRSDSSRPSLPDQDRAGPSEFQSVSESLKSRFNAASLRYQESISRSARRWKERFFSRNSSMSDLSSEVRREVNAGIASVTRMIERLETRDNDGANQDSVPTNGHSIAERSNQNNTEIHIGSPLTESSAPASYPTNPASA